MTDDFQQIIRRQRRLVGRGPVTAHSESVSMEHTAGQQAVYLIDDLQHICGQQSLYIEAL